MARGVESSQYRWSFRSKLKKIVRAGWRLPSPSGWSRAAAKSDGRAQKRLDCRAGRRPSLAAADSGVVQAAALARK
jgi:hypothetical protein